MKQTPVCHQVATSILNEVGSDWSHLKKELTRRLANKEKIRGVFDQRIKALSFTSLHKIDDYIDQGIKLYQLIRATYGTTEESRIRDLVHEFVLKIPIADVRRQVIDRMQNASQRSGMKSNVDWELSVPFTDTDLIDIDEELITVCSILKDVAMVYVRSFVPEIKSQSVHFNNDSIAAKAKWIFLGIDPSQKEKVITKLESQGVTDIKSYLGKDGKIYAVGFSSKTEQELAQPDITVRKWRYNNYRRNPGGVHPAQKNL